MQLPPTYGEQLRAARLDAGWTQKQLATKLGISQSRISGWERWSYSLPPCEIGERIQYELGVTWPPEFLAYEQQVWLAQDVVNFLLRVERDGAGALSKWFDHFKRDVEISLRLQE